MENSLKHSITLLSFTIFICSFTSSESNLWGFWAHKRINRVAVFTLPQEMFGFYKEHIEYITEHAVDPDKRRYAIDGEAPKHYIDIDHYAHNGEDPFKIVPKNWYDAKEKFTEDTLQAYGIVPWWVNVMQLKLQKAFEAKNVDLILKYSADIGHYIGDAHVPLHTTENYNGQLTNQKGIHGFWESRLPEINANHYDYFVGKAEYLNKPLDFIWNAVKVSHLAVDSVLNIEKELSKEWDNDKKYSYEQRGNVTTKVYSEAFSKAYENRLNGMVERRMRAAVLGVGSMWFTAWANAGQPDLRELMHTKPSQKLLEEQKKLNQIYNNGRHIHGREHGN